MIGQVIEVSHSNAQEGFLLCDGSLLSRVLFSDLFTSIGTIYGEGDGSTTFGIPDLRGMFIRGWNHGASTDIYAGDRLNIDGVVVGDLIGSRQESDIGDHGHTHPNVRTWGNYDKRVGQSINPTPNAKTGETRPPNVNVEYYIQYE